MSKKHRIVIGNWKMNPTSLGEAKRLASSLVRKAGSVKGVKAVICPPFVYLSELTKIIHKNSNFYLGAQNLFWEGKGSFTGQTSSLMLRDFGAQFVILGHSELRALGESDEMINKKAICALKNNISVVLCVGENERDRDGHYLSVLKDQVKNCLSKVKRTDLSKVIIAYEPVWAIGKEEAISGRELYESSLFIRKIVSEIYGKSAAMNITIIYGGSVTFSNAKDIITEGKVSGFLVGRQSLDPNSFYEILKIAEEN